MFRQAIKSAIRGSRQQFGRRCIHQSTSSSFSRSRTRLIVAASVPVAAYLTYQLKYSSVHADSSTEDKIEEDEIIITPANLLEEPQPIEVAASEQTEVTDEDDGKGAFDPETGEINWDCPCLGGMADGPCGEEFKAAFSCFVYSSAEPKGVDCVEKFQAMQNCFREHPDVYAEQLRDDDPLEQDIQESEEKLEQVQEAASSESAPATA